MEETGSSILKIYASSTDRIGNKLLYEYLVEKARDSKLSGTTVYRGIMGYGLSSEISTARFWELTEKLPVMIEIIDRNEKIEQFLAIIEPVLNDMPKGCLVLTVPANIRMHKRGKN